MCLSPPPQGAPSLLPVLSGHLVQNFAQQWGGCLSCSWTLPATTWLSWALALGIPMPGCEEAQPRATRGAQVHEAGRDPQTQRPGARSPHAQPAAQADRTHGRERTGLWGSVRQNSNGSELREDSFRIDGAERGGVPTGWVLERVFQPGPLRARALDVKRGQRGRPCRPEHPPPVNATSRGSSTIPAHGCSSERISLKPTPTCSKCSVLPLPSCAVDWGLL